MNIRELLPLYAIGALDDADAAAVEAAVEADPALAAELDVCLTTLVPAVTPSPHVAQQLMAAVGGGRFDRFAQRLTSLFDVSLDRAREILALIDRPASWVNAAPGIHLVHFTGGPACAGADCGFVRIEPGCTFPWHTHRGKEVSVVLEGSVRDRDGRERRTGDEIVHTHATGHDLVAGPEGVLYVACAMGGIEVSGHPR